MCITNETKWHLLLCCAVAGKLPLQNCFKYVGELEDAALIAHGPALVRLTTD